MKNIERETFQAELLTGSLWVDRMFCTVGDGNIQE
jgi:hypothetical protein